MARGRKTKLTPKVQDKICEYIRLGMTYEIAARVAGICRQTLWDWQARGEKAKSGVYREFFNALEVAEADAELLHVKNLTELALGGRKYREYKHKRNKDGSSERTIITKVLLPDAESSKWILGRRFKQRWGNEADAEDGSNAGSSAENGEDDLAELLSNADGYAEETGITPKSESDSDVD